ncbi:MAG: class I SAM-dependent methyltransferase [Bacteroidota bacterium]
MKKTIKKKISGLLFSSNIIGIFINPFYISRKNLYTAINKISPSITGKTLDVGCGQKPYMHLFNSSEYIGMDIETSGHDHENSKVDVFYDGVNFPFDNETFDSVVTNQVLEHVFNPEIFLKEINRVLTPNGKLLLTVPFAWDEHEQPYDYARYSSFGLEYLLQNNGFEIIKAQKTANNISVIFQLLNMYIFKISSFNFASKVLSLLFIVPLNIIGVFLGFILPKNNDLYLDNVILAKKVNHV